MTQRSVENNELSPIIPNESIIFLPEPKRGRARLSSDLSKLAALALGIPGAALGELTGAILQSLERRRRRQS